jgi:hypothetical protein
MKKLSVISMCLGGVFAALTSHAIDLKQSKVTQVVNDVQIISAADQRQKAATVNDLFSMPDILRTGASSRAELMAPDETVTRVGANTIFSFDPANRTLDLQQGSLLFHSPHGKGGGTIHTGSATASVLGTTLIVVTTPNGGFKVLDLEGQVEMKLRNGRRQKLNSGQMTFILPGTKQLAPLIVFRIDELIQNSLLIKGFTETLPSLPLIQNQAGVQLKLIQAGKLADTGLYAGNDATPNQVEVLDANTVSHGQQVIPTLKPSTPQTPTTPVIPPPPPPPPPSNLSAAEAADATINQPSLTDASIPTPPGHVFTGVTLTIPNEFSYPNQEFSGFVANNIYVNTLGTVSSEGARPATGLFPELTPGPLTVDLSSYASQPTFDMLAVNDFFIEGAVTFQGLAVGDSLALSAGNQINFTPGISVSADVRSFSFYSPASLSLNNVSLYNLGQDLILYSAGDVSLQNNSLINAGGAISITAVNNISVADSQLSGTSALFTSLLGAVNFDSATINADSVNVSTSAAVLNNTIVDASSSLVVATVGELDITGSTAEPGNRSGHQARSSHVVSGGSALYTDPTSGTVSLSSRTGSVNVSGTSITAHYLTLNSGDGILLDAGGQTLTASGSGATANFTAPNTITVNNADFSSFALVNMAANTIDLFNVAFRNTVNLHSHLGIWNNGSVLPGAVNDLGGVTYNGALVNSPNGSTGLLPGTGITVGTLH